MADKILNTRIKLKYDTLDNWMKVKDTFTPLKGEIAVVAIPSTPAQSTPNPTQMDPPQFLLKVGDGTTTFGNLPWVSAQAADVYAWAKGQYPFTSITDKQGNTLETILSDIGSSIEKDTNTTYKIEPINGKPGKYKFYSKEKNGSWDTGVEFGVDKTEIETLINVKAAKVDAIGSFKGTGTATITPVSVSGSEKTSFTIDKVANATNATNVNLTATGTNTASITVQAGTGTAASFTVNKVAEATKASQDGSGNDIVRTYATQTELNKKLDANG